MKKKIKKNKGIRKNIFSKITIDAFAPWIKKTFEGLIVKDKRGKDFKIIEITDFVIKYKNKGE